jgi:hypothetical protein
VDPGVIGAFTVAAPNIVGLAGNMDGNHPVGMPMPLGGTSDYNGQTTGPGAIASEWVADPEALGIRLFNDASTDGTLISAGAVVGSTGIECSSCHDPHNAADVQDAYFLRGLIGGNTADYICVKCHNK